MMDQETATEAAPPCRVPREQQRREAAATRRRCRSCAAVAIADCVALGCCPCAVVSLLGLALVKAPLVVGRRCVGRLRRRRIRPPPLLHKKRVRDVAAHKEQGVSKQAKKDSAGAVTVAAASGAVAGAPVTATGPGVEAELAWLEEMYRVGHWGFGRVSFSGEDPAKS